MADTNMVILIGRLTRDAELKYTSGGMAISKFAIAVNRRVKNGEQWAEEASFFDVVVFGRTAEAISQYLVKGKQIAVEGELVQQRWEKDGQSRSKVEINASNVQLLGGGTEQTAPAPSRQTRQGAYSAPQNEGYPEQHDFPDDLQF